MLTQLELERFRGFKKVSFGFKPITLLAGPNNSGKTSVLHAVRLACAALSHAIEDETVGFSLEDKALWAGWVLRDHTRLMRVGEWEEMFTSREVGERIEMTVTLNFDTASRLQRLKVYLTYARNGLLKVQTRLEGETLLEPIAGLPKKSKNRAQRIREELKRAQPLAVLVPAFYGVILSEEYRSNAVVSRLLEGGEQSRIVRNLVARLDGKARQRLNTFLQRTLGAEITRATSSAEAENVENLEVRFRDWDGELELSSAGGGLINLIALYTALERYRPARAQGRSLIFLLDEPEAHLHPRLQGETGVALADLVREFDAQLIAATHSVEMINRLGRRDDTVLLHMDRARSAPTKLTTETEIVRELGAWCDLTPFASLNFLASRRILFHEGPTDADILTRCAEVLYRNDDARLRAFRSWTLVPLEGVGNADAATILAKVLSPKLFPSLPQGDKVSVVRVLDRDHERSPGSLQKETETVRETQIVWSRHSIESLFLSPTCLAGWLSPRLEGIGEVQLKAWIEEALAAANKDQVLEDKAIDGLAAALRKSVKPDKVIPEAREKARKEPEVWQQGRGRAHFVLGHVRDEVPSAAQNKVASSILGVLRAVQAAQLGSLDTLIPEEIRKLLDYMTQP